MKIYLIEILSSYDYRKFPWIKKTRGHISLRANMRVIVAENKEEAERKYWKACGGKFVVDQDIQRFIMGGLWPFMCKEPNQRNEIQVRELDRNQPIGQFWEYMSPDDICLLQFRVE